MIAQRQELSEDAVVEHSGHFLGAVGKEVGTAHVADEEGVAGEHAQRLVAELQVAIHDRDTLHRVSRRVKNRELHVAQSELIAFLDRVAVLEVELAAVMDLSPVRRASSNDPIT